MTMTLPRTLGRTTPAPGLDRAPARRNQSRVALGAFLVVALGLAFAVSYSTAGDRQAVLAVARPVAAGQVISAADVTEVRISGDPGLHPVQARDRSRIVGRTAGVALTPGTLVTPAQVADGPSVPAGRAVVGAALKPGQFPPALRVGDAVDVVITPATSVADPTAGSAAFASVAGRVSGITPTTNGADTVVSLDVAQNVAPALAVAAGRGQVSLVLTGGAS
jgi:hypothetical protein